MRMRDIPAVVRQKVGWPDVARRGQIQVNFIVVLDGLTNQLLGVIVRNEDPRLEDDKNRLLFQVAKGNSSGGQGFGSNQIV